MDDFVRHDVFEAKCARMEDENKRQNERLKKLEDVVEKISEIAASVQLLAQNMDTMSKELARKCEGLKRLEEEPADKWKKLTWLIVTGVGGAILGFVLSKLGL